ncbi:serine carboxypeptidase S28-domain-containing protein [Crucibulum laeve]|uniref:Serine carboxypeptidase S28-domain-containing protein n=1 Tax=Crucibulum laeve TaxID=68775 RepID=A0A5C3LQ40_9AGAR|nr:serine carboxypeptidase S28-domain-containing protein [Crucibulum laeve]
MLNTTWRALLLFSVTVIAYATPQDLIRVLGPQGVNLWKLEKAQALRALAGSRIAKDPGLVVQEGALDQKIYAENGSAGLEKEKKKKKKSGTFRPQFFEQPLDHFSKKNAHTWHQRYWVNTRHYDSKVGGPVIVLDGGETSGEDRLPFLDTGIVEILARATGGVGVVLEHRYYGESIPVSNFTTDSLRWLNNDQAAADSAEFMAKVKFDGIDEDLTAPGTPWIYYGGSYAGARAAHMKILYPELVYGAIASSAVTHAALENWQYMEIIRNAAPPKCSAHIVNSITTIDKLLDHAPEVVKSHLKGLFGLGGLAHDDDFVSVLESPLGSWQAKCWDPAVGSTKFEEFCETLGKPFGRIAADNLEELPFNHEDRLVPIADGLALDFAIVNYASWIKQNIVSKCPPEFGVEDCFGTYDGSKYLDTGLDQDWRLWLFQVCTEWGYFTTAPPDQNQPRIVSKLLTLGYESKTCKQAFPPGEHFTIPNLPNITAVNILGDFAIAADRLAIIDGEVDPWRPDTPHSDDAADREDTILRPFKLIPDGVHHYDEYGLENLLEEPPEIRKIHGEMIVFVMEWLKDWKAPKKD